MKYVCVGMLRRKGNRKSDSQAYDLLELHLLGQPSVFDKQGGFIGHKSENVTVFNPEMGVLSCPLSELPKIPFECDISSHAYNNRTYIDSVYVGKHVDPSALFR